jgi:hypothetical protein
MAARPSPWNPALVALECSVCGASHDLTAPRAVCATCGKPLVATYDLPRIAREMPKASLGRFGTDLWRYRALLPFAQDFPAVRLGEGGMPLLPLPTLGRELDVAELWLKDEAGNPTQSFKARGLSLAVNGAIAWGIGAIALPSAGNAGSAAAAYAAAAGIRCRITVPEDTPEAFLIEQRADAEVRTVPAPSRRGTAPRRGAPPAEWWNLDVKGRSGSRAEGGLLDRRTLRLASARRDQSDRPAPGWSACGRTPR